MVIKILDQNHQWNVVCKKFEFHVCQGQEMFEYCTLEGLSTLVKKCAVKAY